MLVFNRGGPGSYGSRQRRGVTSQKETQFYSEAQQIPRSLNQHFHSNRSKPHTGQDKPYLLAAAATYDEWQAQYAAELQLSAIIALVVCAVCCCLLLLLTKNANSRMCQRVVYSALFTQFKLFRNKKNDKPIEHSRINSTFRESVWKFSQKKKQRNLIRRKCRS